MPISTIRHKIRETLVFFVLVALFTFAINLVVGAYRVQQTSMEATFEPNQVVLAEKIGPHFAPDTLRGWVVTFQDDAIADVPHEVLIKRVIGVAGDTIAIHDGAVYRNGTALAEPYVLSSNGTLPFDGEPNTWTIGPGQVFVLGDHRDSSVDSRKFGPIPTNTLLGRVFARIWPLTSLSLFGSAGN